MGKLKWYARDPRAALAGMMELSLEERGAYNTLLDLIYCHDGAIDDELYSVAGWLRVNVRVWSRIRKRLIDTGKLYSKDGKLHNERADIEIAKAILRASQLEVAGRVNAHKRWHRPSKINGVRMPTPMGHEMHNHNSIDSFLVSSATITELPQKVAEEGSKKQMAYTPELAELNRRKGWIP